MNPWFSVNANSAIDLSYIILSLLDDAGLHSCREKCEKDLQGRGLLKLKENGETYDVNFSFLKSFLGNVNWDNLIEKLAQGDSSPKQFDTLFNLKKSFAHLPQPSRFQRLHRSIGLHCPSKSRHYNFIRKLRPLKVNVGHQSPIYTILWSKNGEYIFTGADDKLVKQWSASSGKLVNSLRGHIEHVNDLATPTADLVVSCSTHIRLWHIDNAYPVKVLTKESEVKRVLSFSENILVSTSKDGDCYFWDIDLDPDQACISTFIHTPHPVQDMNIKAVHNFFEIAGFPQLISQTDDIDGTQIKTIAGAKARLKSELSTEEMNLFLDKLRVLKKKREKKIEPMSCAVCPLFDEVAVGYSDGAFQRLRVSDRTVLSEHQLHLHDVESMRYSHNGIWLATASEDGLIRFLKRRSSNQEMMSLKYTLRLEEDMADLQSDEDGGVVGLEFSKYDEYFVCSINPGILRVYRVKDNGLAPLWDLKGHEMQRVVISVHPFFPILCTADQIVVLWDLKTGSQIAAWQLQSHLRDVLDMAWSPDGTKLALCTHDGSFILFGLGDRTPYTRVPKEQFFATDYHPLKYDCFGAAIDQFTEEAPHSMQKILVNKEGEPYNLDLLKNYTAYDEYDITPIAASIKAECIEAPFDHDVLEESLLNSSNLNDTMESSNEVENVEMEEEAASPAQQVEVPLYIMEGESSDTQSDQSDDEEFIPNANPERRIRPRRLRSRSSQPPPRRNALRDLDFYVEPVDAPYIPPATVNRAPSPQADATPSEDFLPMTRSQARRRRRLSLEHEDHIESAELDPIEDPPTPVPSAPVTRSRRRRFSRQEAPLPSPPLTRSQRRRNSEQTEAPVAEIPIPLTRSQRRLRGDQDFEELPPVRRKRRVSRDDYSSESEGEEPSDIPPTVLPPPRKRRRIMRTISSNEEKNLINNEEVSSRRSSPTVRRSSRISAKRKVSYTEDDFDDLDDDDPSHSPQLSNHYPNNRKKRRVRNERIEELELSEHELVNDDSVDSEEQSLTGTRRSKRLRKRAPVNYDQSHLFDSEPISPASMPFHMKDVDTPGLDSLWISSEFKTHDEEANEDAYSWLLQTKRKSGNYVPQIGDSVIYHVTEHRQTVQEESESDPKHPLKINENLPSIVECIVKEIYFQRRDKEIVCEVVLGDFNNPLPYHEDEMPSNQTCKIIFPSSNNGFLIPASVYNLSLSQDWKVGDRCRVAYVNEGELNYYPGIIRQQKSEEFEIEFDGSEGKKYWLKKWELQKETIEQQREEEERFKPPSVQKYQSQLQEVLNKMKQVENSRIFLKKIDFKEYWDYLLKIECPIWLEVVEERLENDYYSSLQSFMFDIHLLANNAKIYNKSQPPIIAIAEEMLAIAEEFINSLNSNTS